MKNKFELSHPNIVKKLLVLQRLKLLLLLQKQKSI